MSLRVAFSSMYGHIPSVSAVNSVQLYSSLKLLVLFQIWGHGLVVKELTGCFFTAARWLSWIFFFFLLLTPENKCRGEKWKYYLFKMNLKILKT